MAKRRRRKEKEYPTSWVHVWLDCKCRGGRVITLGKNAYKRYDEMKGEDRVIKCGECRTEAQWKVVDDGTRDS
jgi:hypothetical protein